MIWLLLIAALLILSLGALLLRAASTINRLKAQLTEQASDVRQLHAHQHTHEDLIRYWMRQSEAHYRRYQAARDGLLAVQSLGTPNMANIGHRMQRTAKTAIDAVYAIPLNKD